MIRVNALVATLVIALFSYAQWQGWSAIDEIVQWAISNGITWR